ncbi:MAG TPA: hypothetical protein VEZ11_04135 [Thermoanaerobaculia bacterium]|nr:hypothetical protein [Thermoanaerobaculia bacterium]
MEPDIDAAAPSPGLRPGIEIGAIAAAVLLFASPLLTGRVLVGYDVISYLIMGQQTGANLRAGLLLPAWAVDLNCGFGSPALLLYPPLLNFVHGVVLLAGVPLVVGVTLLAAAVWIASGIAVWSWLRVFQAPAALAGALVYVTAPYRLYDVYERGALSEHWSFLWVPLILLAAIHPRPSPSLRAALVALGTAALILTSIPFAVLFGLLMVAWFFFDDTLRGRRGPVIAGALLGGFLSSFALVPQALASRWVMTELFYSAGAERFRPSHNTIFLGADSLAISAAFLVMLGLLLIALLLALRAGGGATRRIRPWAIAGAIAFAAALPGIGVLWDVAPILSKIQFPWRSAGPLTLCAAVAVALVKDRRHALAVAVVAALAGVSYAGRMSEPYAIFPAGPIPPHTTAAPDPAAVAEAGGVARLTFDPLRGEAAPLAPAVRHTDLQRFLLEMWFIPRGVTAPVRAAIAGMFPPSLEPLRQNPAILVGMASAPVRVTRWSRLERSVRFDAPAPAILLWRSVSFPGMEARLDGHFAASFQDPATGLFAMRVPAGAHEATWRWSAPTPLSVGRWLSLAALIVLIAIFLRALV